MNIQTILWEVLRVGASLGLGFAFYALVAALDVADAVPRRIAVAFLYNQKRIRLWSWLVTSGIIYWAILQVEGEVAWNEVFLSIARVGLSTIAGLAAMFLIALLDGSGKCRCALLNLYTHDKGNIRFWTFLGVGLSFYFFGLWF